ncbi:hypothetical protein QQS21_007986 [Conoideocrella luteorostrata]|uniref:Cyclin-D1-binding protein 1-like N-terminal domain-containing protein n=1 Tax=Conoideocrella luteorostrata TaxID=1105319 RepID=A0AAJ0CK02_9HYPO|nr:hypothetical protein QQS21_007986 [Conoideocrella luteorostrata]
MPPAQDADAIKALDSVVQTASSLLSQLQAVLGEIQKNPEAPTPPATSSSPDLTSINALSLANDSASLIRAHGTKISLLIINEPFTPSAVSTVLRELIAGPIPGLVSSAQACTAAQYTQVVRRELAWRAQRVLSELSVLVQKIPKDGKILSEGRREGFAPGNKGSLPATGMLWSACDELMDLSNMGVSGLFVKKVDQWKDILSDVMEELKEWGDEEPEDEDDADEDDLNDLSGQLNATSLSTQAMLDQLMNSQRTIPASDPDGIRPRLETSLKRLRLVTLLYQALAKRRLKKLSFPFPQESNVPSRLDEMAKVLAKLPDSFGDLAAAFYELQPEGIDSMMDQCFLDAFAAGELFVRDWQDERDAFSEWIVKFRGEIKKV